LQASGEKKIYIADDEANIRLAIKKFLENAGYVVEDFESGDLLLEAFSKSPCDLVVLDVMMPGSNGFVVCKELRKISHAPIIMLTARDSDLDYATGLDLGCDDYLIKPFSPMALVMRVKAIFRRMEFDRQIYAKRDLATGLFDKVSGVNLIEGRLAEVDDGKPPFALFIIDIDRLKSINENFGREAGDKAIVKVAEVLSKDGGEDDVAFRFAGNEFVVLAADVEGAEAADKKARAICATLKKTRGEGDANVSVSIGAALFPEHGASYEALIAAAREALAKAKKGGGNGHAIYAGTQAEEAHGVEKDKNTH